MNDFTELTVIVKDEEKTLKKRFALHSTYCAQTEDPVVTECIEQTLKNFDGIPTNVIVNIKIVKS